MRMYAIIYKNGSHDVVEDTTKLNHKLIHFIKVMQFD
jgi:hypothetical protein